MKHLMDLGHKRNYCFINGMNLAKAGDVCGRVLKMLFLIMKTMIPELLNISVI